MEDKPDMKWQSRGPTFNSWWLNFKELAEALIEAQDIAFWVGDSQLKYLNIRIDTRDNGFIITDTDGVQIDPQRVLDAIAKYKERWVKPSNTVSRVDKGDGE